MTRAAFVALAFIVIVQTDGRSQESPSRYALIDTAGWGNMMYGGTRALLYDDGALVDTVDVGFGVQHVSGGVLYLSIRSFERGNPECGRDGVCSDLGPFMFYDAAPRALSSLVPQITAYSSPGVIDSLL